MLCMLEGLNGLVIFLRSQGESVRLPVAIYSDRLAPPLGGPVGGWLLLPRL